MISIAVVSNYILPSDYMTAYTIAIANHLLRVFSIRSWNHTYSLYLFMLQKKSSNYGMSLNLYAIKVFLRSSENVRGVIHHMWLKFLHNCVVYLALLWFGVGTFWKLIRKPSKPMKLPLKPTTTMILRLWQWTTGVYFLILFHILILISP